MPIDKQYHLDLISLYWFNKSTNICIYISKIIYIYIIYYWKKKRFTDENFTTNSSFPFDFYSQYFFLINLFFPQFYFNVLMSKFFKNLKFIFRLF